jgi:predicted amidohydrolase
MRIGCLQSAPQLEDVNQNLNRADAVLSKASPKDLDLLVLPELAFSGEFPETILLHFHAKRLEPRDINTLCKS